MLLDLLGPKPIRSTAAFLWMPQFRLSFQHMAHLVPVFMRTLAGAFVQTGILQRNHPAMMYGAEGVRRYGFGELIGEAWFTLRTTRASVSQWGVFISIMLMLAMVMGSLVTFLMTVAFGVGATAQAQLFSHPAGDSSIAAYPRPTDGFDMAVPSDPASASSDYGIMMLDKVIRAGAHGVGTPLQNATQGLMQVYNSGVLVIASVMLFWIIMNVVLDTAKTGQVGGGRHNMVWAPIRIVFALALLVPLGSTGYSSGQFMVMKLAEWGSNFGTNAWIAYVRGVTDGMNVIAPSAPFSVSDTVVSFQKVWLCQTAYNAFVQNGRSNTPEWELVSENMSRVTAGSGTLTTNFTNKTRGLLGRTRTNTDIMCGSISYVGERADFDVMGAIVGGVVGLALGPAGALAGVAVGSSTGIGRHVRLDAVDRAMGDFKKNMRIAYYTELRALDDQFKGNACRYIAANASQFRGRPIPGCGMNGNDETEYSTAELQRLVTRYGTAMQRHFDSEMQKLSNATNRGGMLQSMESRGWAGMGIWYHRISQINAAISGAQNAPITITDGSLANNLPDDAPEVARNTSQLLAGYTNWWASATYEVGAGEESASTGRGTATTIETPDTRARSEGLVSALRSGDGGRAMDAIVNTSGLSGNTWLIKALNMTSGRSSGETYPMAILSNSGGNIFWTGVAITGANLAISIALGLADAAMSVNVVGTGTQSSVGQIIANSYPMEFFAKLGTTLLIAGMMMKFYIPLIPFIRVSFAVLTWIISVFEAVALVPIAALSHLTTEGDGIAGGAKQVWILWLNVLLRPVMTVLGYVGALLVFNGFVAFFHDSFLTAAVVGLPQGGLLGLLWSVFLAVAYMFIMYTVANTTFKMLDVIPAAMTRWLGGSQDQSFDSNDEKGILYAASNMIAGSGGGASSARAKTADKRKKQLEQQQQERDRNNSGKGGAGDGG